VAQPKLLRVIAEYVTEEKNLTKERLLKYLGNLEDNLMEKFTIEALKDPWLTLKERKL